jgi:hypothetical protein
MLAPILALLAAGAPPAVSAQQAQRDSDMKAGRICGTDARRNETLAAELKAKPGVKILQDNRDFLQLVDLERAIVWSFTVKGGPAFPAVSCSELGPLGGHLVFRQAVLCNGASQTDCAAFFEINRRRNAAIAAEIEAQQAHEPQ